MSNKEESLKILSKYREIVWPIIENKLQTPDFPKQFQIPKKYKAQEQFHWEITREYPERFGKYLRPTVLLLTAQAMGSKLEDALLTAAAMQLSEEWILIHDDIEDKSDFRRGKPTLQKMYPENLAINAGDTLHSITWELLSENFEKLGVERSIKIKNEFAKMIARTTLGQTTEMKMVHDNIMEIEDDDWYFIADGKTSYYTVSGPIRLGAIIAGATEDQLDKLADFGINLGRCFQLVDDILDVTSNFDGQKDQVGNDIYESKRTLLLGHLIRESSKEDKKEIIRIISKPRDEKSEDEVKFVMDKMREYESVEYARKLANQYKDKAHAILDSDLDFLKVEPFRNDLKTLTQFILERDH